MRKRCEEWFLLFSRGCDYLVLTVMVYIVLVDFVIHLGVGHDLLLHVNYARGCLKVLCWKVVDCSRFMLNLTLLSALIHIHGTVNVRTRLSRATCCRQSRKHFGSLWARSSSTWGHS